jgi:hypothetical protein
MTATPIRCESKADADDRLAELQRYLPTVDAAYRPSGRFTAMSLAWLAGGALLGVPVGAVVGTITAAVISLALGVIVGFILVVASCGKVILVTLPVAVAVALGGFAVAAVAFGAGAAMAVSAAGSAGNNRNPALELAFALPSAVGAFALTVGVTLAVTGGPTPRAFLTTLTSVETFDWTDWLRLGVWGLSLGLALVGACLAYVGPGSRRFCEACELPMRDVTLPRVGLGGARALAEAAGRGDLAALAGAMAPQPGGAVTPKLAYCPQCDAGFIDAELEASFEWVVADAAQTSSTSWRFISVPTARPWTERLRSLGADAKPPSWLGGA